MKQHDAIKEAGQVYEQALDDDISELGSMIDALDSLVESVISCSRAMTELHPGLGLGPLDGLDWLMVEVRVKAKKLKERAIADT